MAARHKEGCYLRNAAVHFLVCKERKGLSNDDVGVARGTVFQEVRPGAGFKTGGFVEEMLGGVTAERLCVHQGQDTLEAICLSGLAYFSIMDYHRKVKTTPHEIVTPRKGQEGHARE